MTDLILKGGQIIDPVSGRDETVDVSFAAARCARVGSGLRAGGAETIDARGLFVVPGLIDLHNPCLCGAGPRSASLLPK
jgi:dihydroorotase